MEAKLVVVGGEAQAGEYRLSLPAVVGRSRRADLKLPHALVSRQHCELYEADGVLMVRDMGSLNGTFVGESRITIETAIEPGDLLTIGSVTFRAVYGGASDLPQSEQPAAAKASPDAKSKAPAPKKKAAEKKPAATDKPAEIDQTQQAGGLAALEQLRAASAAEGTDDHAPIVASESADDFDFNWLEDSEPEAASHASGAETEEAPEPDDDGDDEDEPKEEPESMMLDLGEQDADEPEEPAAKDAEPADEDASEDAAAEETQTVRVNKSKPAGKPSREIQKEPPAAKPDAAADEDDGLDDFFKSLG